MANKTPAPKFPDSNQLIKTVTQAIMDFRGPLPELESAIGMLFLGYTFGWRVLYMVHSIRTVRKYEGILGIVAKDAFPETTPHSERSRAFNVLGTVSNFWKAVKGEKRPKGFSDPEIR